MEEKRQELVVMLIRFFNSQACTSYRCSNSYNQELVNKAIDKAKGEVVELKQHIKAYCQTHIENVDFTECFETFVPKMVVEEKVEERVVETAPTNQDVGTAMEVLSKVILQTVSKQKEQEIEERIMKGVDEKVKEFIKSEYGSIERKITTVVDGKPVEMGTEILHSKFDTIVKFVANDIPVFLTGNAGTGKNVLCKQIAKALGLEFYFTNAVTQEYKITGFTDAMGTYHETQFYKAFKNGGLFMLDEMDASIPEVLVILNSALANRYFDFPAPIGYVEAHPNFKVISAGNTFGLGANSEYVGRNQLDMASLDRFAMVHIDYDRNIELRCANNDESLVDFIEEFRKACNKNGVRVVVSYRSIERIAKMDSLLGTEETLKTCLLKSLERDDLRMIKNSMSLFNNKYYEALKEIAR